MLTETQITQLRPAITEYPERRLIAPGYPPVRRKRGVKLAEQAALGPEEGGALPEGGLSGRPVVRLWSISISSNVGGTSIQRGSPSFVGPALIHSLTGTIRGFDNGTTIFVAQIAYQDTPYNDTDSGPDQARLPGTHIAFNADPFANAGRNALYPDGFVADLSAQNINHVFGVYVSLPRFYIGLLVQGAAAGAASIIGNMRIIEGAPPESIAWV